MASYMQEINILRLLLLVFAILPFVRTTNIDCNGKAFHCVNSTHFMICVDIGHGLSSTVDDFVIPCPMNTECRITNRFECEYPPPPSTTTLVSTTNQVIDYTTTLKKMEPPVTTVSPFHKQKYVTVRETSFLEESAYIGPYTSAVEIPPNVNEILENVTENNLDFQGNEIDNGNGLNLLTTISSILADPASTTTSPQDTTITESITQVDEIPKTVYDSARNSPQYETTPINVVSVQTSTDFATDSDLVFTPNNEFTTETFATDIYTNNKATTKNSEIVADGNILNANVLYIINEEFSTTTTDSVKLTSGNIFATDNIDITTEFRTTINDIQDSFDVLPKSISPTKTIFVDGDSSTLLMNVFNSFTTEPVITQNFKVPLTSYTSLYEIPATDSTNYTTLNQDAEEYSGYNNEKSKTNVITSNTDWKISVLTTESDPLHFASTPSSTIMNEASIITLDGYSTEPKNSEMYVLTNDYTEKSILTASNYTTLNSKGIITKAKESKNTSNLDENITKSYTDARTTYDVLPTIENKVETVADFFDQVEIDMNIYKKSLSITSENLTLSEPVELQQILNENSADVIEMQTEYTTVTTENINNSGIMKVTADTVIQYSAGTTPELLVSISFTETADTTSKYDMLRIQQPYEKESVKIFTSEIDDEAYITGTILETSSNVNYTTIMSKIPEATLQELPTEADTKKLTSKIELIPNIISTIVPADIDQVAKVTKIFRPNSLSSKGEKSNVFNKDTTVTKKIQAIESTTNHLRTISQTTTQSTLNNYLKYYDTVSLAHDELLMNNETTTSQTNIDKVIGSSSLKGISISKFHGTENMVIDTKSELVSTSMAGNLDVQIDQAAYITVPVDTDSIAYDSNLKHIKNDIYKDTVKIQAKEFDSINYDTNNMYGDVVQNNLLATDESTTNAQIIQNAINTDSKFHDMSSVNYEPIIFTTAKNDILIVTSEYLDSKMGLATQSNAENIVGISTKYIDTSKLQSGQDMVFQLEKNLVPTTEISDSDIRIGQVSHNTVTTSDNIDYDGNLGYTENNIQKETHTSESSLSTFTYDDTNILLTSLTVTTDKPKSLDSSTFNSLSNTKATTLSQFFWENQTFQNFEKNMITTASIQSPTAIQHQNSDSFSYIDFTTSNKKFAKEENNVMFATETGRSNRNGNNSDSMRYHDTVAIILNKTEISNITRIAIEINNPVLSTNNNDSSGTILNDNLTTTENSLLKTHINTTKKVSNKPSIFKSIGEVQNEIIKKDVSVNSHKVITQINPKDRDDNFILDINENKLASRNMSHDKFESNTNYNQIVDTFPILTVSAVLVETSSKTVRAKTENMTLPYGENRYQNSHTNIQNMTDEVKVRDGMSHKNTTSYSIDESNKQAQFAFSSQIITDPANKNQTKGNLREVQSNKANNSILQNIKPNFNCLYRFRGRYADIENCRKFYICIGRPYPIFGMCPVNTVFSEFRKQCTKNLSHCVRNYIFYCTSEGRFIDIFNNNMYYICVKTPQNKFVRYKLQCENGYYLNKDSMQCVEQLVKAQLILDSDNSHRSSDTSITNSNESRKIINKGDSFICEKEGKFPVLNHCRKYYVCSKNKLTYKRKLKLCDSDEVFDKNKEKCVDAETYEC